MVIPSVAICVLLANMPSVIRELRVVREAAPKRVLEDEAALHPPPEALPSNPWDEASGAEVRRSRICMAAYALQSEPLTSTPAWPSSGCGRVAGRPLGGWIEMTCTPYFSPPSGTGERTAVDRKHDAAARRR